MTPSFSFDDIRVLRKPVTPGSRDGFGMTHTGAQVLGGRGDWEYRGAGDTVKYFVSPGPFAFLPQCAHSGLVASTGVSGTLGGAQVSVGGEVSHEGQQGPGPGPPDDTPSSSPVTQRLDVVLCAPPNPETWVYLVLASGSFPF